MTVGGVDLVPFGKRLAKECSKDDISGLAAELSYRFFLALFPFFIFLAALGGFIAAAISSGDPTQRLMDQIGDALPADARSILQEQVRGVLDSRSGGLLSIGIIGAIWASSGAVKSLIKALNRVYGVPETRTFWKSTSLALAMTVAGSVCILGSFGLLIATQAFGSDIAGALGAGGAFELTVAVARWPIVIVLVMLAVGLVYWMAPNIDVPFRWVSPGAVTFTLVWLMTAIAFGLYVANFGSYNKTYGTLGGVVVLLTWLYLSNLMLLLGAEINATLAESRDPVAQQIMRQAVLRGATREQRATVEVARPVEPVLPSVEPSER
ncbi:MAG: YihY/virulence factor BrkB family protein [Anaerolineaceae bacterium]